MTVKEASKKFCIEEKEVRKRIRDGMVRGVLKEKGRFIIPDNTAIIPSKKDIQYFLFQILKFKNNESIALSRSLCPDKEGLQELCRYLYINGFIGQFSFTNNIQELFRNIMLTDTGLVYILGNLSYTKLSSERQIRLSINPTANVALVNIVL